MKYLALLIAILLLSTPVAAQSMQFTRNAQLLDKVNSYAPEQSSRHEGAKDILKNRIIDKTNRVVGKVNDILLSKSGVVKMIDADFDRINLGTDTLFVNYSDLEIQPATNGYKMGYTDDQIKEQFPALLAGMQSASGAGSDLFSARKIAESAVRSSDGKKLGKIKDILFDNEGTRAELLFVSMNYKSVRGETLAIPFNKARYKYKGKTLTVIVDEAMAAAMIAHAEDND